MAEWIALGIAATAITVGVTGAIENYENQKAQADLAEDNAKLQQQQLEYNKRVEEREAAAIEAESRENARRQRLQAEYLKSQQRALLGKSGAAMTSGSPLAILGQSAADEELMIQDTHYAGARSAAAHRTKAADYEFGSALAQQNITAAKMSKPSGLSLAMNLTGATIAPFVNYDSYSKAGKATENAGKSAWNYIAGGK